jgi:thimet oligopeptidase
MRALIVLVIALLVAGAAPATLAESTKSQPAKPAADAPFLTGLADAAAFEKAQAERMRLAREALDRLLAVKGPRTVDNTLTLYDEILRHLEPAGNQAYLMSQVHPDAAMREVGDKLVQQMSAFETELSLNRGVYDALAAVDAKGADADTRFYLERTLRDFRLAGVDKDEATRAKVRKLQDELVLIGQEFDRNIR